MDKYDPEKTVGLIVDEWGGWYEVEPETNPGFLYQQNTMRDAMIAGTTLNIFNNHCERVKMANLAQTINVLQAVILTQEEKILLTPTYHVMDMYKVHQDAKLIPIHVKSVDYQNGKELLKAISASASINADGKVHISLVNIHAAEAQEVTIAIRGMEAKRITSRILTADKLQTYNTFDFPNTVQVSEFKGASLEGDVVSVEMPPFSVLVVELVGTD